MAQRVQVPGLGIVEFPDGLPREEMERAIKERLAAAPQPGAVNFLAEQFGIPSDRMAAIMGPQRPVDLKDEATRVGSTVNERYIAPMLGAPVDAANWLLKQVGLGSEKPFLGSEMIAEGLRDVGASGGPGYEPQTTGGKLAAGALGGAAAAPLMAAGVGGAMAAGGRAFGAPAVQAAGQAMAATPGIEAAAGAGAGALGEVGRDVGGSAGELVGNLAGGFAGGGIAGAARQAMNPALQASQRLGIAPTAGTTGVGGRNMAAVQNNLLAQSIGGGGIVNRALDRTREQIDNALQGIAERFGAPAASTREAGETAQQGIQRWFDTTTKRLGQELQGIEAPILGRQFQATNTMQALANPLGRMDNPLLAQMVRDPLTRQVMGVLVQSNGAATYNDLRQLRSWIGRQLDPRHADVGIDGEQAKKLYGALSDDMQAAVASLGPQALQRWQQVNAAYAGAMNRFRADYEKLLGNRRTPMAPEQAYNAFLASGQRGGRENLRRLRAVFDGLRPAERGQLSATILSRMGRTSTDETDNFTVAKFLSDYGKLTPEARRLLFDTSGNAELRQAMDDLLTVTQAWRDNVDAVSNTSRTGTTVVTGGQIAGAGAAAYAGDVTTLLATLAGPAVMSWFLTNPRMVRGLAWALRGARAGGRAAARVVPFLQSLQPPGEREPLRIDVRPSGAL